MSRIAGLVPDQRVFDIERVAVSDIFHENPYDVMLHCATNYGRREVPLSDVIEANLLLPLRLLEAGQKKGLKTFVNTDTMLKKNVSGYTLSKRQFGEWLQLFSGRLTAVNMVIEHFYGPGDDNSKFVSYVIQSLLNSTPQIAFTEGAQKRDFIYVDDVVDAFVQVLDSTEQAPPGYSEYEVGSGNTISVKEMVTLAKKLCDNADSELLFGAIPYRPNEPMDVEVDISKLRALGWSPKWNLREGLLKTIEHERRGMSLNT